MQTLIVAVLTPLLTIVVGGGCHRLGTTYPSEDTLPPGIFLEAEERIALPEGVELRPVYEKGIHCTKTSEGFRGRLYHDVVRFCTIGYGHLIRRGPCDGSESEEFRRGITEPRGTEILVNDMGIAQRAVMMMTSRDLTDGQFAALVDFTFNVGTGKLKTSSLLKAVNAKQFDRVPAQFRRWMIAGGKEVNGLKVRREREIELFFDGLPEPRAVPPEDENLSPIDIFQGE
jgi:lysozyme